MSAPAVMKGKRKAPETNITKPTRDMLRQDQRERFTLTPGLAPYMNVVLHLSTLRRESPYVTGDIFLKHYENGIQRGERLPALYAVRKIT